MKRMLISTDLEEARAAVVEDDTLVHLEIEPVNRDSVKGNIYRGVVARVEPSLQSAFVDFGRTKQGFLPVGEIHPKIRGEGTDKRTPIQQVLKAGQTILVQVTKDEIGNKGATLTTFVSLPGRYLVLMPESDKTGVSRKLSDAARARVKELTEKMKVPDGFGLIVRTAGERATKLELTKDLVYLNRLWAHIDKGFKSGKGTASLYHERSLAIRFVRDYFKRDIKEIVVDDEDTLAEVTAYIKLLMPRNASAVERYSGVIPLFARYGIAGQVESVFARQVPMRGGGSIVIDQTEALVAIDVNSGRVKGKDIEETARQTNLEAAREVARQLVLRDLGGLVVIDFIDMRDRKYVREVEAELKAAMKNDKARHKLGRISEFGLMELSRQRLKSSVNKGVFETCEYCSGTGFYRTTPSLAASVMRRIHELVAKGNLAYVVVTLPPEASNYLLNAKRAEIANVEREYHVSIEIIGVEGMTASQVTIEHTQRLPNKSGVQQIREARFKRVTRKLDLVRNKLLKQEEARIDRKLAASLSGAAVDFAEVYSGVLEDTAGVAKEAKEADARRAQRRARDQARREEARAAAAAAELQQPAAIRPTGDVYAPPQPQGFTAWLKGIFGFGSKAAAVELAMDVVEPARVVPSPELEAPQATPTDAAAADAEAAEGQAGQRAGRDGGRGNGRGSRRSRGPRDQSGDAAAEDEEGRNGRRRNGRRRRRRDDDRRSERKAKKSDEETASSADPASDASSEARGDSRDQAAETSDGGRAQERGDKAETGDESTSKRRRRRRGGGRRRRRRDEEEVATDGSAVAEAAADGESNEQAPAAATTAAEAVTTAEDSGEPAEEGGNNAEKSDSAGADAAADGASEAAEPEAKPAVVDARALAQARLAELRAARAKAKPAAVAPAATAEEAAPATPTASGEAADAEVADPEAAGAEAAGAEATEATDAGQDAASGDEAAAASETTTQSDDAPEATAEAATDAAVQVDEDAEAEQDLEAAPEGESETAEAATAEAATAEAGTPEAPAPEEPAADEPAAAAPDEAEQVEAEQAEAEQVEAGQDDEAAPASARNPFVIDMRTGGAGAGS